MISLFFPSRTTDKSHTGCLDLSEDGVRLLNSPLRVLLWFNGSLDAPI